MECLNIIKPLLGVTRWVAGPVARMPWWIIARKVPPLKERNQKRMLLHVVSTDLDIVTRKAGIWSFSVPSNG